MASATSTATMPHVAARRSMIASRLTAHLMREVGVRPPYPRTCGDLLHLIQGATPHDTHVQPGPEPIRSQLDGAVVAVGPVVVVVEVAAAFP